MLWAHERENKSQNHFLVFDGGWGDYFATYVWFANRFFFF